MTDTDLPTEVTARISNSAAPARALREHHDLQLEAVCLTTGIDPERLWQIEGGDIPTPDERAKLAAVYGVEESVFGAP
ncbi:helix-turn-helix domain-containing protein [Jiella sp. M17.18]|uniref:helix-turn-helix domain-containing protein n=1 Tax=Jiella sp. M17.18 TaxID=3234247 RepID=UPI0034DE91D8